MGDNPKASCLCAAAHRAGEKLRASRPCLSKRADSGVMKRIIVTVTEQQKTRENRRMTKNHGALMLILWLVPLWVWPAGNDWPQPGGPDGGFSASMVPFRDGEPSVLWRLPRGSAAAPVVHGGKVFAHGRDGDGESVTALDPFDCRILWRRRFGGGFNPAARLTAPPLSPLVDLETGSLFVLSAGRQVLCFAADGTTIWSRHLAEQFGFPEGFGARHPTWLLHEGLLIATFTVPAADKPGLERLVVACDKSLGELRWVMRAPAHDRLAPAPAVVAPFPETPVLIVGGFADGLRFLQPQTGLAVAGAGLNQGSAVERLLVLQHQLFILNAKDGGSLLRCIDLKRVAGSRPVLDDAILWTRDYRERQVGWLADAQILVMQQHDGALEALERLSGRIQWRDQLGNGDKPALHLFSDTLVAVSTIGVMRLPRDTDRLGKAVFTAMPFDTALAPPRLIAAYGRLFVQTDSALTALGYTDSSREVRPSRFEPVGAITPTALGEPVGVQIRPAHFGAESGRQVRAFTYDAHGRILREVQPQWSLAGLSGSVDAQGRLQLPLQNGWSGTLIADWQGLRAETDVVRRSDQPILLALDDAPAGIPPRHWSARRGMVVEHFEGERMLVARTDTDRDVWALFGGFTAPSAQVSGLLRAASRGRHQPEMGLYYRGFLLTLMENGRFLRLSYGRGGDAPGSEAAFQWKPNIWYHLKIELVPGENGLTVRAKAWPQVEREPEFWLLTMSSGIGEVPSYGAGFFGHIYGESQIFADSLWLRATGAQRF